MDKSSQVIAFIMGQRWLAGNLICSFLAAGEYNENYLVRASSGDYTFRINHCTQLSLTDQIAYEFRVGDKELAFYGSPKKSAL